MIKRTLGIFIITTILFSCGNKTEKKEAVSEKEVAMITVDFLKTNIESFVDKDVVVAGIVNHVCSHGGKRMFMMGENPDLVIKVTPNDKIGVFEKELEGNLVFVTGVLKELRINEEYVANLEKEVEAGSDNEAIHDHSAGTHDENEENEHKAQLYLLQNMLAISHRMDRTFSGPSLSAAFLYQNIAVSEPLPGLHHGNLNRGNASAREKKQKQRLLMLTIQQQISCRQSHVMQ